MSKTWAVAAAVALVIAATIPVGIGAASADQPGAQAAKKGKRGKRGPRGRRGRRGKRGPKGAPGVLGVMTVDSPSLNLPPGADSVDVGGMDSLTASCPGGYEVIGTGYYGSIAHMGFVLSYGTFVGGFAYNDTAVTVDDVHVQAICAKLGGASLAHVSTGGDAQQRFRRDLRAARTGLGG